MLRFDQLQDEIDQVQYRALLRDAQSLYLRGEWGSAVERIGVAKSLQPQDQSIARLQEAMWKRAIELAQIRCRQADALKEKRAWTAAEAQIVEAEKLLNSASVPANRFDRNWAARLQDIQTDEDADWTELSAKFRQATSAGNIDEAVEVLREAVERHPARAAELNDMRERVAAREREIDAADAEVIRVAEEAMEATDAASQEFPWATAGVCRVLLGEIAGKDARARLEDELERAQEATDDPELPDLSPGEIIADIDEAIEDNDPVLTVNAVGKLTTTCPNETNDVVAARAGSLVRQRYISFNSVSARFLRLR